MWARRYQWEAGLSDDELTAALMRIALDQRAYAQRNPAAMLRGRPLDVRRLPGRADDRVPAAVSRPGPRNRRRGRDRRHPDRAVGDHPPVWIRSAVQGLFPYAESISVYGELRNGPNLSSARRAALAEAGVRPSDLVAASIYDATSISVLLGLEGFGIHSPGTAARAVADHGIGLDSPLPINTSGGHLSEAYVHGMNLVVEAVRLCRGESANQVPRSGPVLVSSGPSAVVLSP